MSERARLDPVGNRAAHVIRAAFARLERLGIRSVNGAAMTISSRSAWNAYNIPYWGILYKADR
jgi:hypothetical protein